MLLMGGSLVTQMVKASTYNAGETWVRYLGQEDPLEKEMGTHSSTLALKIPWTEEPGRLQSMGLQRVTTRLSHFTSLHFNVAESMRSGTEQQLTGLLGLRGLGGWSLACK